MRRPDFPAIHFPDPIVFMKGRRMGIAQSFKNAKDAPRHAMQLAVVALLIAGLAMLVALGKK